MLARRNADKLRAVGTDGASVRYHLRMNDGATGVIDAFELFDGVSLAFNNIPRGVATWNDVEPFELQIDWCLRGRFQLDGGIRLGEGDLGVHDERVRKRSMGFPAPLYAGLTIRISQSVGAEVSLPLPPYDWPRLRRPRASARRAKRMQNLHARPLDESPPRVVLGYRRPGTSDAAAPQNARTHRPCQRNTSPCPTIRRLPAKKHDRVP